MWSVQEGVERPETDCMWAQILCPLYSAHHAVRTGLLLFFCFCAVYFGGDEGKSVTKRLHLLAF